MHICDIYKYIYFLLWEFLTLFLILEHKTQKNNKYSDGSGFHGRENKKYSK